MQNFLKEDGQITYISLIQYFLILVVMMAVFSCLNFFIVNLTSDATIDSNTRTFIGLIPFLVSFGVGMTIIVLARPSRGST